MTTLTYRSTPTTADLWQSFKWSLWIAVRVYTGLFDLWRPLALAAGIIGAAVLCVAVPALPVGLSVIAVFGWLSYPRKRGA